MIISEVYNDFVERLSTIYSKREASNITELVFEHHTGVNRLKRLTDKTLELTENAANEIKKSLVQLLQHKPVQYVLEEAWFYGKKFIVNEAVLIPRPETEELVELVISNNPANNGLSILDIGTGSGCIAVALKSKFKKAEVTAIDISDKALEVAKQNAINNNTTVYFERADILNKTDWNTFQSFDVIISNPPYIPAPDKITMADNVLKYEPYLALFTPADDPLTFYRAIAAFGSEHLNAKGKIYVEIHEDSAEKVKTIFSEYFAEVKVYKDMMEKDRMVTAFR
jgi:release factor glutamine methyltransferase